MKLIYSVPEGVIAYPDSLPLSFSTSQGGRIITDKIVLNYWRRIEHNSIELEGDSSSASNRSSALQLAALSCLSEANLLTRSPQDKHYRTVEIRSASKRVSIIIVSYNNPDWLKGCIPLLYQQSYQPFEIIVVDNGSIDNPSEWLRDNFPQVKHIQLKQTISLAAAINTGIRHASGVYFLLINPDVRPELGAIAQLVNIADEHPQCAAVAAKLKLLWAPAFLNGLGNYVGANSWGTDCALGHLDLGQFDHWEQVPSACFAAALLSSTAWEDIGELDEGFPLYYEDTEWCYRARLMGYSILAAPEAVFNHAFGSREPFNEVNQMQPQKLRRVTYGRLRFATRLLGFFYLFRFLIGYLLEDILRLWISILRGRWHHAAAFINAWNDYRRSFGEIMNSRIAIQKRRKITDSELFSIQKDIPPPNIRHGNPVFTMDLIKNVYLPLILTGKTRSLPEFPAEILEHFRQRGIIDSKPWIIRIFGIWKDEGLSAMLHRIGRMLEWHLMR